MNNQPLNLICNCCGNGMKNTAEDNMDFGTNRRDYGFGTCVKCAKWSIKTFFTPYIEQVAGMLKPENSVKFKAMPRWKQEAVICGLVEKGSLTFKI